MRFSAPTQTIRRALVVAAILGLGLGTASTAVAQDLKVGYVNLNRALAQTEKGQAAKKRLKEDFRAKQKKLNKKQKEIKKLKKKLASQSKALSKKARRQRKRQLRRKLMKLQRMYLREQRALSKRKAKETKDIFAKMRKVVQTIAEEKGYDLVLEKSKSSVLFAKESMDLTEELITRFDKKYSADKEEE
ncbi:MAG: OmpH family outer membrane protein [Bradymonadaceae bacterium]